jgi:hypothetical protein
MILDVQERTKKEQSRILHLWDHSQALRTIMKTKTSQEKDIEHKSTCPKNQSFLQVPLLGTQKCKDQQE